jgi:sugar lactone lactonase YvrE
MFAATHAGAVTQSAAWDVTNARYQNLSLSVASQLTGPFGLTLSDDGLTLYVVGEATRGVYQYTLSAPYSLNGATYANKSAAISQNIVVVGVQFSTDGTNMYVGGYTNPSGGIFPSYVYQYSLSTPWDVSTATYASKSLTISTSLFQGIGDIWISPAGTQLFMVSGLNDRVYRATLSTAWDLSTATTGTTSFSCAGQTLNPFGLTFSPDRTRMFVTEAASPGTVFQYALSTAGDLSTVTYTGNSFSTSAQTNGGQGIVFSPDGRRMFVLSSQNDAVYEYGL